MRETFMAIVDGWSRVDDFDDLVERIERSSKWMDANGPLLEDEASTVRLNGPRRNQDENSPRRLRTLHLSRYGSPRSLQFLHERKFINWITTRTNSPRTTLATDGKIVAGSKLAQDLVAAAEALGAFRHHPAED